jgi:hypothetical protein
LTRCHYWTRADQVVPAGTVHLRADLSDDLAPPGVARDKRGQAAAPTGRRSGDRPDQDVLDAAHQQGLHLADISGRTEAQGKARIHGTRPGGRTPEGSGIATSA